MVGLRSSYRQLKQKVNSSKKSRAGTNEIFQSQCPFYDDMGSYLKDFVTTLPTESNLEKLSRTDIKVQNACKRKQSATIKDDIRLKRQVMMKALHKLDDKLDDQENSVGKESTDDVFSYLIGHSITGIPHRHKK